MAFDYYNNVHRVIFEIESNRIILSNYIRERQHLIDISNQYEHKPKSYDDPLVQSSSKVPSDLHIVTRISELTVLIQRYEIIIKDKEKTLVRLRGLGKKILKKLEARNKEDLKLRVFIATYLEGKSTSEIKNEIPGYEMQTIWNAKTQLNAMMRESSEKQGSN